MSVVSTGVNAGRLYLDATKEPVIVRTAECGNLEPIYPDQEWESRLTEDEKDQIVEQAIKLKELCPEKD